MQDLLLVVVSAVDGAWAKICDLFTPDPVNLFNPFDWVSTENSTRQKMLMQFSCEFSTSTEMTFDGRDEVTK